MIYGLYKLDRQTAGRHQKHRRQHSRISVGRKRKDGGNVGESYAAYHRRERQSESAAQKNSHGDVQRIGGGGAQK